MLKISKLALAVGGLLAAVSTQSVAAETTSSAKAATQPNILMIFTDDMGYADVSSFAQKPLKVKTPNIDRLAQEGMRFAQFYVAMPICSPSRAAVLSGMHAPETQITTYLHDRKGNQQADQNDFMDPALAHLPKSFKAAGYATAHVGKWHLGGGRDVDNAPPIKTYGYDEAYSTWESPDRDPKLGTTFAPWDKRKSEGQVERWDRTRYMVDTTLDFMKRNEGKPSFVTLWPDDLHTPYRPSPEMLEKHSGSLADDRSLENFYGVLEEYDKQIGRLLDGLKAQGMEDNTIVFFTGDNGPNPSYDGLRSDGLRGSKGSLYEGGTRQPFIIRWPGHIKPGSEDNQTILSSIDLLPTLTAMAGIPVVAEAAGKADGQDMSQAMAGTPVKRVKPLLYEFGRTRSAKGGKKGRSPQLAIREGDYKLLVNHDGSDVELYNLITDRGETKNVAKEHPDVVKDLSEKVLSWGKSLPHRTHPRVGGKRK